MNKGLLLLLLLSRFSRVRLCVTPQMAAYQAPPSLGFSRQEHWSGLPFPSPMMKVKSESEITQSCPTLSDPMGCRPPGSSIHGIFQARTPEWVAIAFSNDYLNYLNIYQKTCHVVTRVKQGSVDKEANLCSMQRRPFPVELFKSHPGCGVTVTTDTK